VEFEKKNFDPLGCFAIAWVCEILQNFAMDTRCLLALLKVDYLCVKDFGCKAKAVQLI
jgi:hypothetical protein